MLLVTESGKEAEQKEIYIGRGSRRGRRRRRAMLVVEGRRCAGVRVREPNLNRVDGRRVAMLARPLADVVQVPHPTLFGLSLARQ